MSDVKTQIVAPPDLGRESLSVLRGALSIAVGAFLISGIRRGGVEAAAPMSSYQVLFVDQSDPVQLKYRELVAALEDIVRLRTPADDWPTVDALVRESIEPFGESGSYRWEFRRNGSFLNYLGCPAKESGAPTFLLLLQENVPHPGNAVLDEFHRKLDDGTILHVGVWFHPKPRLTGQAVWMPEREGWTEIVRGQDR